MVQASVTPEQSAHIKNIIQREGGPKTLINKIYWLLILKMTNDHKWALSSDKRFVMTPQTLYKVNSFFPTNYLAYKMSEKVILLYIYIA